MNLKFAIGSLVLVKPSREAGLLVASNYPKQAPWKVCAVEQPSLLWLQLEGTAMKATVAMEECIPYTPPPVVKRVPIDREATLYRLRRDAGRGTPGRGLEVRERGVQGQGTRRGKEDCVSRVPPRWWLGSPCL